MSPTEVERARRDAAISGVVVAVAVAGLSLIASTVLFAFAVLSIILGVVFCLTVIGVIIGIPLILLGILAAVGAAVTGVGIPFALLLGGGVGFLWYRNRVRRLPH